MTTSKKIGVASLVAAALVAAFFLRNRGTPPRVIPTSAGARSIALRSARTAPEAGRRTQNQVIERAPKEQTEGDPIADPQDRPAAVLPDVRPFEEQWAQEARDVRWATAMETRIRAAFEDPASGASLVEVDCRTTLCRVEIDVPSPEAFQALAKWQSPLPLGTKAIDYDGRRLVDFLGSAS